MRKLMAMAAAVVFGICGCTTIESTQKFNGAQLGNDKEKAVCFTHVEIPGLFFFGLPIVVGSAKGHDKCTAFRFNLTTENAIYLLTKEARMHGATRLQDVTVSKTNTSYILFDWRTVQASGVALRPNGPAAPARVETPNDAF